MWTCGICLVDYDTEDIAIECYNICEFAVLRKRYLMNKKKLNFRKYGLHVRWIERINDRKKINKSTTYWRLADSVTAEFGRFCDFCYAKDCFGETCGKNKIYGIKK